MYNFKPFTGKTENLDHVFLKTTQVIKDLCSSLIEDSTNLLDIISVLTGTTHHHSWLMSSQW
jgi:hypothetical protein